MDSGVQGSNRWLLLGWMPSHSYFMEGDRLRLSVGIVPNGEIRTISLRKCVEDDDGRAVVLELINGRFDDLLTIPQFVPIEPSIASEWERRMRDSGAYDQEARAMSHLRPPPPRKGGRAADV